MKKFGSILRELREEKNISCVQLSRMTGISVRNLYRWEKGDTVPRFYEDVEKIAEVLKVPEEMFFKNDILSQRIRKLEGNYSFLENRLKALEGKLMSLGIID